MEHKRRYLLQTVQAVINNEQAMKVNSDHGCEDNIFSSLNNFNFGLFLE